MHRVLLRRPLAYVSCIIFCAIVYRVPSSWGIIYMNSSDLANYTVSFTALSRIMKNLRNAFIYTASTQQRNGNFQQWLSYNALCLGKATPSHCILETMRPRASASSSSHCLTGRSALTFFPFLAVPLTPGGLPSQVGSTLSQSSPWLPGKWDHVQGMPLGRDAQEHPSGMGLYQTPSIPRDYIAPYRALYLRALCRAGSEEAAQAPTALAQDRLLSFEVPPAKLDPIPGQQWQHRIPLYGLGCSTVSPHSESTGHVLSLMLIRQCEFLSLQTGGFRNLW